MELSGFFRFNSKIQLVSNRKKILVLAEWFAPAYKAGGPITSIVNLVNAIDEVDFYVITTDRDLNSNQPFPNVKAREWISYNDHTKVIYLDPDSLNNKFLSKLLNEIHFDVVYLNSMFSLWFTLMPLWWCSRKGHKEKVVLAPRGMLKDGALSVKATKKKYFLRLIRLTRLLNRISWHASSEEEVEEIKKHFGADSKISLVSNIPNIAIEQAPILPKEVGIVNLVTVARISPEKGMSEAIRFLDQSELQSYTFNWKWYGPVGDEDYFDECLRRLKRLSHVGFEYKGEIDPAFIPSKMTEAHIFYLATRGENFGHSIAEALSLGRPVIISNKTPWHNLEMNFAGFDLELDDEAFGRALRFVAEMDHGNYEKWSSSSRKYLLEVMEKNDVIVSTKRMFGIAAK
jgi:glycosyltransferase involved in cell wall biosynthesis